MEYSIQWRTRRKCQESQRTYRQLNSTPPTPIGFADGFFPGSALNPSFRRSSKIKLQSVELDSFPYTATTSILGNARVTPDFNIRYTRHRRNLERLTPNFVVFPVTPPDTSLPQLPAYDLKRASRISFTIRPKKPLDQYFQEPALFEYKVSSVHSVTETRKTKRRRIIEAPGIPFAPVTSPSLYDGYYPASALARSYRVNISVRHQTTEHNVFPASPPKTDVGEYPASRRLDANRVSFKRKHLSTGLDEFPATPASSNVGEYPAHVSLKSFRVHHSIDQQTLNFSGLWFEVISTTTPDSRTVKLKAAKRIAFILSSSYH